MDEQPAQSRIYQHLAAVAQAMANPHRLKILSLLSHGEKSIDELAGLTGQSLASTSAHVKLLRASHLVEATKRGRSVLCRLMNQQVLDLWLLLRSLGETNIAEVREIMRESFDGEGDLAALNERELAAKLPTDTLRLLDLRPADEFAEGHLPSAVNIPFDQLETSLDRLPRKRRLLVYCRGPFCAAALAGSRLLRKRQFNARRLRFSVPEWKAAGLPIESAP
ncbi:MAG TPA: metalloregulator ArsR/SmtB family transcription factor [Phycisphaerae bacterium]|nr:metalloregulator ArsR/SmtB family transcription factor [Phycisphaerae bacterium]HRW53443.1 metalloregulator ArsR/SmtB family transcription factor [Phycisphaerae bacterium]